MMQLPPKTVYAITHRGFSRMAHSEQVSRLLSAGALLIQLRDKERTADQLLPEAEACSDLCRRAGACLIINDDPELAVRVNASGVHVGQGDTPPRTARHILGPHRLLGISTHNRPQLHAALEEPVNYIAVGPVFGTSTKENPDLATGLVLVREAAQLVPAAGKQLVVIGGITRRNLRSVLSVAPGAIPAIIGGIMKTPDIGAAFREFQAILDESPRERRERMRGES